MRAQQQMAMASNKEEEINQGETAMVQRPIGENVSTARGDSQQGSSSQGPAQSADDPMSGVEYHIQQNSVEMNLMQQFNEEQVMNAKRVQMGPKSNKEGTLYSRHTVLRRF